MYQCPVLGCSLSWATRRYTNSDHKGKDAAIIYFDEVDKSWKMNGRNDTTKCCFFSQAYATDDAESTPPAGHNTWVPWVPDGAAPLEKKLSIISSSSAGNKENVNVMKESPLWDWWTRWFRYVIKTTLWSSDSIFENMPVSWRSSLNINTNGRMQGRVWKEEIQQ